MAVTGQNVLPKLPEGDDDFNIDDKKYFEKTGKFPDTLYSFGFGFNNAGQLRKLDPATMEVTDKPFEFNVSDDADYNQKRYEALGEVITQYMYDLLETDLKLRRLDVPVGAEYLRKAFIYGTDDCWVNSERLLILVQGSGVVRAGQWARSLIINDGLETGSQIPYINKARLGGQSVLVLNPNESERHFDGEVYPIKHSRTPEEHFKYVWKHYIKTARAQHIAIVAHSYGGVATIETAQAFSSDFKKRVYAVAMTDSAHGSLRAFKLPSQMTNWFMKVSRNWIADSSPLDSPVHTPENEITRVSAGHTNHCMTSSSAISSVFDFIEERYQQVIKKDEL